MARLCRSCCGSMPFGLGADSHSSSSSSSSCSQRSVSKGGSRNSKVASEEEETTSEESWDSRENESQAGGDLQAVKAEAPPDFRPPSEMQVQLLAKTWITHVQQRAAKIWTRDQVIGMLETIARSVNYTEDPILGDMSPSAPCVQWHGDLSHQQGFPVLSIQKPSNPNATSTYLCRVLAFLFADDASLKLLKQVYTLMQVHHSSPGYKAYVQEIMLNCICTYVNYGSHLTDVPVNGSIRHQQTRAEACAEPVVMVDVVGMRLWKQIETVAHYMLGRKVGGGPGAEMNCGNPTCARLSHLVGYNSKWAQRYAGQPKAKAKAVGAKAGAAAGPKKASVKAKAATKAKPKGAPPAQR